MTPKTHLLTLAALAIAPTLHFGTPAPAPDLAIRSVAPDRSASARGPGAVVFAARDLLKAGDACDKQALALGVRQPRDTALFLGDGDGGLGYQRNPEGPAPGAFWILDAQGRAADCGDAKGFVRAMARGRSVTTIESAAAACSSGDAGLATLTVVRTMPDGTSQRLRITALMAYDSSAEEGAPHWQVYHWHESPAPAAAGKAGTAAGR